MPAAKYGIKIEQGTDFALPLTISDTLGVPVNLSGDTFRGSVRSTFGTVSALATFGVNVASAAIGVIVFTLSNTQTAALPSTLGVEPLVYDIERVLAGSGLVSRVLQGKVKVSPEVTI
jgi:hypothetical protein